MAKTVNFGFRFRQCKRFGRKAAECLEKGHAVRKEAEEQTGATSLAIGEPNRWGHRRASVTEDRLDISATAHVRKYNQELINFQVFGRSANVTLNPVDKQC